MTASQGIDAVLPTLYTQLRRRLGLVLYKHHIPLDDAEDLVQTTLLLAVARWNEIRHPEAWLLGTVRNRCILYWRERKQQVEWMLPLADSDLEPWVEPDQSRRDLLTDLGKVWHHLSPIHRRLLTLRYAAGLSSREAADAMGLAYGSVRKTMQRAVVRLREALALEPPPRLGGRGQRGPRKPATAPGIADRLRAEGAAAAAWMTAVDAFASLKAPHLHVQLMRDLAAAGLELGPPPLAEMAIEGLERYRLSIGGTTPSVRARMLYSLRSFLLWAGERGEHALQANAVRQALRVGKTIRVAAAPKPGAAAAWLAPIEAFLAASSMAASTQRQYRQRLTAVGATLGWRPLAELSESDLVAFRAALLTDGRAGGTHLGMLAAMRSFLSWTAEQGLHAMDRDAIRVALRGWKWQCASHDLAGYLRVDAVTASKG